MASIAFLGLGAMGVLMADRLLKAGHQLVVWNRTAERADRLIDGGAAIAASPREAAAGAQFVISMVADDAASRFIWLDPAQGALPGMLPDSVAIESSTLSVGWIRDLAREFAAADTAFLDAPVAGSRRQAEAQTLIFLVGGDGDVVERARHVFAAMGAGISHAGPSGSGAVLKLAVNLLLGTQVVCIAEILALMRQSGLDPAGGFAHLAALPVCSPAAKAAGETMLSGNHAPQFPVQLMEKDLLYVIDALGGADAGPLAELIRVRFAKTRLAGLGRQNLTAISQLYGETR